MGDADVVQDEAELGCACHKLLICPGAHLWTQFEMIIVDQVPQEKFEMILAPCEKLAKHLLSHGNQLSSIKFCHHLLQHLICDGGKHLIRKSLNMQS